MTFGTDNVSKVTSFGKDMVETVTMRDDIVVSKSEVRLEDGQFNHLCGISHLRGGNGNDGIVYGLLVLGVFILALFLALPITELAMGSHFKDEIIDCNTNIVSISTWLIVKGSIGIFVVLYMAIAFFANASKSSCLIGLTLSFGIPFILALIFSVAWLIIGSIVFWRDCVHLGPSSVNTLMWCSLIIGYVSVAINWTSHNKNKRDN